MSVRPESGALKDRFTPSSVKENVLELNKDMMDNGLAIT